MGEKWSHRPGPVTSCLPDPRTGGFYRPERTHVLQATGYCLVPLTLDMQGQGVVPSEAGSSAGREPSLQAQVCMHRCARTHPPPPGCESTFTWLLPTVHTPLGTAEAQPSCTRNFTPGSHPPQPAPTGGVESRGPLFSGQHGTDLPVRTTP